MIYSSNFNLKKSNIVFLLKDTDYTYDMKCCERTFKTMLKDMYVRECIGLCRDTRNIQSRQQQPIPVICDPVRHIPDRFCRVKREMMP